MFPGDSSLQEDLKKGLKTQIKQLLKLCVSEIILKSWDEHSSALLI